MFRRYRFTSSESDYRPVMFPPPGPFWCSGYDAEGSAILIAILPEHVDLKEYWPEAENIDSETLEEITYTSRFPKPDWLDD